MAKKLTPQQRQIQVLAKTYQTTLAGLGSEYESAFAEKQKKVEQYNKDIESYQQKLDAFNAALTSKGKKVDIPSVTLGRQGTGFRINGEGYPINDLPAGYYAEPRYETRYQQVRGKTGLQPYEALAGYDLYYKELPKFDEKPPESLAFGDAEEKIAQIEEKRKDITQTFEREKVERRSARLRAVTQGSRERPMLSKGVTLNG